MSDPLMRAAQREPDLFDILPPPAPVTTQQAGLIAGSKTANERYQQIVDLLRARGPLAGWQIAEALGCQINQISGRLTELVKDQVLEDSGERRVNPRTKVSGRVLRLVVERPS